MGFRNPWRFSVDRATGELWVGDVGEQTWEEIDLVVRGGNYGWPAREGTHCYFPPVGCQTAGLIDPVIDYQHPDDGQAVTGGFVYRGSKIPELVGKYLFGDYGSGRIWTIDYDVAGVASKRELYFGAFFLPSFAEDLDGELYVMDLGTGRVMALAYQPTPKPSALTSAAATERPNLPPAIVSVVPAPAKSPAAAPAHPRARSAAHRPGRHGGGSQRPAPGGHGGGHGRHRHAQLGRSAPPSPGPDGPHRGPQRRRGGQAADQ